jgi:phosphate transport system permease protein
MTIPLVASMSDDAISSVPQSLRENGYALGATRYEVLKFIVIPSALSGILASFILAFSRAIGETMAVTMAAGATPNLSLNPLLSVQTMTAYIAQVSMGDTPHGTIEYQSIFIVGFLLFVITLITNLLAQFISKRLRMA